MTPSNKNGNFDTSSSTYKDLQERRNSTIWNAIAHSDYKNFVKEEETKRIKQREQQESIKNFLDKQVKEQQFKKTVQDKMHASGKHDYILFRVQPNARRTQEVRW